jgi:hypothetical protein
MDFLSELRKVAINESGVWIRDWVLEKRHPDLVSQLKIETSFCPETVSLQFRYQLLDRGMSSLPKCGTCGKDLIAFKSYCNTKCANNAPHRIEEQRASADQLHTKVAREKAIKTCQKKYGADFPFQSPGIQEKASERIFERFGASSAMQDATILSKARATWDAKTEEELTTIQQRRELSTLQSTGSRWAFLTKESVTRLTRTAWLPETRKKRIQTNLERWGHDHPTKNLLVRRKLEIKRYPAEVLDKLESKEFWLDQYFEKKLPLYQIAENLGVNDTNIASYFYRFGFEVRESSFVSNEEVDFRAFLLSAIDGEEVHINCKFSEISEDSTLPRQELDLYLPNRKLAFEYNGIWYHDEYHGRDKNYHLRKTLECERLGVRLIHVWSDDWILKRDCMISKILALLGQSSKRVYARNCEVLSVDKTSKAEFYRQHHIKGNGGGSIDLGLFHQDQLVACMTLKDMKDGIYDLNRYATSCSVVGGFSKLLSHFKKNTNWSKIYTYADRSWSRGDVYLKSGFSLVGETEPEFYGVEGVKRINRLHYTKELLSKILPSYRDDLSQLGNLRASNIPILWGCGQLKFEISKSTLTF